MTVFLNRRLLIRSWTGAFLLGSLEIVVLTSSSDPPLGQSSQGGLGSCL